MLRRLRSCHNVEDMRLLAKQRLPGPIFHYIDGAADDEVTYRRNTQAFEECDLVPNVLAGVGPHWREIPLLFLGRSAKAITLSVSRNAAPFSILVRSWNST